MKSLFLMGALGLSFLFTGCETMSVEPPASVVHTVTGNPDFPVEDLQRFYPPEQWALVRDRPYAGYVILRGSVNWDGEVKAHRVWRHYPDASRDELAQKLGEGINLSINTVGSRTKPTAEVYVIFYDNDDGTHTALIFAKQITAFGATDAVGQDHYLRVYQF